MAGALAQIWQVSPSAKLAVHQSRADHQSQNRQGARHRGRAAYETELRLGKQVRAAEVANVARDQVAIAPRPCAVRIAAGEQQPAASLPVAKTIGIFAVAALAANAAERLATITATCLSTRSAANPGS
jgi:hypothetical protein